MGSANPTLTNHHRYEGRDLEAMAFAQNYHRWIVEEFRPFLGQNLVEVGAGSGNFTSLLLGERVNSVTAIEPSEDMYPKLVERLRRHGSAQAVKGLFRDVVPCFSARPDTILYVNVLEHIEDDQAEVEAAFAALTPGGHLCLFVPALPWLFGTFDEAVGHRRRYRRRDLESRVTQAGFELRKSRYFDAAGVLPWWVLFCLLKRRGLKSGQVSLYDRAVVPFLRVLERAVKPPLGKNLLLVGRKPDDP